jgi:hypothetical protein
METNECSYYLKINNIHYRVHVKVSTNPTYHNDHKFFFVSACGNSEVYTAVKKKYLHPNNEFSEYKNEVVASTHLYALGSCYGKGKYAFELIKDGKEIELLLTCFFDHVQTTETIISQKQYEKIVTDELKSITLTNTSSLPALCAEIVSYL